MPGRNIRLDDEAYKRLKQAKRPNESFSPTIKRIIGPRVDVEAWCKRLHENSLSQEATRAIETKIAKRRHLVT